MKGIPTNVVWGIPRHPKNNKPRSCGVYMFRRWFCFSLVSSSGRLGYNVGLDFDFFLGIGVGSNFRILDLGFIFI
jgi:hypothetical protein